MDSISMAMPEEIFLDILTRLPVKSLCRCKCVSKLWRSTISSPRFVVSHLSRSKSRPKLLMSVRSEGGVRFYSVDYPAEQEEVGFNGQHLVATSHGSIGVKHGSPVSVSDSGIICFASSDGITIGNPITAEYSVIPKPTTPSDIKTGAKGGIAFVGLDPVDQSDVILNANFEKRPAGMSRVLSLIDSKWHYPPNHTPFVAESSAICLDGVIYFAACSGTEFWSREPCLLAFDLTMKLFETIPRSSESVMHNFVGDELLIEYKGRLALACENHLTGCVNEILLCILEDPKKQIWSSKTCLVHWGAGMSSEDRNLYKKAELCGATPKGELLLATTSLSKGSCNLFLYDIEGSTLRRVEVHGLDKSNYWGSHLGEPRIRFHVENLESPKGLIKNKT